MGARESNAGDDYHFLWATLRVLRLLDPTSDLTLVKLEALAPTDDPDDDFEAVDVAEYLGGDSLANATELVLSQLKYSVRHPDKAWTVGQLTRLRKHRSVLRDLARLFSRLYREHGRATAIRKLRLCLVSNRPADGAVVHAISAAQGILAMSPAEIRSAALLRRLDGPDRELVSALRAHLDPTLKSVEFVDLLRVLDLSECGSLGRTHLERAVREVLTGHVPGRATESANALHALVRREAQPESTGSAGLRRADVLAQLGGFCGSFCESHVRTVVAGWARVLCWGGHHVG